MKVVSLITLLWAVQHGDHGVLGVMQGFRALGAAGEVRKPTWPRRTATSGMSTREKTLSVGTRHKVDKTFKDDVLAAGRGQQDCRRGGNVIQANGLTTTMGTSRKT